MKAIFVSFASGKLVFLRVSKVISRNGNQLLNGIEKEINDSFIKELKNKINMSPMLYLINQETIISIDDMIIYEMEEYEELNDNTVNLKQIEFDSINKASPQIDLAQEMMSSVIVRDYILDIEVIEVDEIDDYIKLGSIPINLYSICKN